MKEGTNRASTLAYQAWALVEGRRDLAAALVRVREAMKLDHSLSEVQEALRRARCRTSAEMKRYRLTLEGKGSRLPRRKGIGDTFYVRYDVLSESPEEALSYVREFEDEEVCVELQISKVLEEEPAPGELAGVEWRHGAYIVAPSKGWRPQGVRIEE